MKLDGRTAVVTGGARGIGHATAERLLHRGVSVSIWDIDSAALEEAKQALETSLREAQSGGEKNIPEGSGPKVYTAVCDVSDPGAVSARVEQAEKEMGGIDIFINNAGYMAPGSFLDQPAEVWKRTIDINLSSIIYTCHAVLPGMYERGRGHIVNVSSAAGMVGVSGLSAYCGSKWGVYGLTESLRAEAKERSGGTVRFSSVHPMFLKTGMFEGASLSGLGSLIFPRVASHDVIAKAIVESAIRHRRKIVMRPRSLRLIALLRGLLPYALFTALSDIMNVNKSMKKWRGRSGSGE